MDGERAKLVNEYYSSLQTYSQAVSKLRGLSGTEFEYAYQEAERARLACERCRIKLEDHETTL